MSSLGQKLDYLNIPLEDIKEATKNFAHENLIRQGGLTRKIYKGQLSISGKLIEIVARRLDRSFGQRTKEFETEIMMLSCLKHQNLVSLVGACDENDEKIIITEFEARGSLDRHLSDPTLGWTQRLQICLGIARALSYIHYDEGRSFSVIHRNIKSSNILLGDEWEPKLSGFELSITQPVDRRHGLVLDTPCGMPGYMDPEYVTSGSVTNKSDLYSLGVVFFEVMSGKKACIPDNNEVLLATSAKSNYESGKLNEVIHPGLQKQMDSQSLKIFSDAAYYCLNEKRGQRPTIDQVIFALEQALIHQLARKTSEHSAQDTSLNHWKGKNLEHLRIGYYAIKKATENFSVNYQIGSGGYGAVYKSELEHYDFSEMKDNNDSKLRRRRSIVAIKKIFIREDTQGEQGFFTEVDTLSRCVHPNIVSLLGFCYKRPHMILVYEYVSKGSLDSYLSSKAKMITFTWAQRIKICIDIARGLDYLHTPTKNKETIIHRDIKSANILLGENWKAKIADFGLSKLHPLNQTKSTIITNNVVGTKVYWDPEYEGTGHLKKESDVYSFGVVLFEILTGRLAHDSVYTKENEKGLAPIVRQHFERRTLKELVDPKLKEELYEKNRTPNKGPDEDPLHTFCEIGYQCLSEKQAQRPSMNDVINKLDKLYLQEIGDDKLRLSIEGVKGATRDFSIENEIGKGGYGTVYRGEILLDNEPTPIAAKRNHISFQQGGQEFLTELETLLKYKHENIISLIGYCDENNERISIFEYACNGSLDRHVNNPNLTWTKRLKISIDVAMGLDFLHGGGLTKAPPVVHRDIKSANILLNGDWKAKITDFGLSTTTQQFNEYDSLVTNACGTLGYIDPAYLMTSFLTRESDIYSLGVVLFEIMCGRLALINDCQDECKFLSRLVRSHYKEGKVDELVFKGIKDNIVENSITTYQRIAYQCLDERRAKRPTASEVVLQLKKALEFQEDYEIWEGKLPRHYKEITQIIQTPEKYTNICNKDLYDMFSKGILLPEGKVCLSSSNRKIKETVSATMFSYENQRLCKWRAIKKSRFQRVVKMTDTSNLKIRIKIKTQFLTPDVIYGAYLVFKFCEPRKLSSKLMYVNLKYQMGKKTLHAYFATSGNGEWMMIELCRFIPHRKDVDFEVLLESLSQYYCGSGAIYVEGIQFKAINVATLKVRPEVDEKLTGVERVLESNSGSMQQVSVDYEEIIQVPEVVGEKSSSLTKENEKNCHTLQAKTVLYESSDLKRYNWKSLAELGLRFIEMAELLSHQVFRIKCKIDAQKLSPNTNYACYLIFELSQKCHGLQCPVKVRDVLLRKNKEFKFLYFRSPRVINFHGNERVPEKREDGLMEVIVWELNSSNKAVDDHIPMSLKLRCYEGTMSGLIVYGIEFRPV